MKHLLGIGKELFLIIREYCIRMLFFEFLLTEWVYSFVPSKFEVQGYRTFLDIVVKQQSDLPVFAHKTLFLS